MSKVYIHGASHGAIKLSLRRPLLPSTFHLPRNLAKKPDVVMHYVMHYVMQCYGRAEPTEPTEPTEPSGAGRADGADGAERSRAEPSGAERSRAEPSGAERSRAERGTPSLNGLSAESNLEPCYFCRAN